MYRSRASLLLAMSLSVALMQCAARPRTATKERYRPRVARQWKIELVDAKYRFIKELPFRTILTTRAILDRLFDCVRALNEARENDVLCTTPARFSCTRVQHIALRVGGTGYTGVAVDQPDAVFTGACVYFQLQVEGGASTAQIEEIRFFKPGESAGGKPNNSTLDVGTHCQNSQECVLYVGLASGTMTYRVEVLHGTEIKFSDPDLPVKCDDCGDLTAAAGCT